MEIEGFRYGFSDEVWQKAKNEARAILYEVARRGGLISYSELVDKISTIRLKAHDHRLDHFLGQIASEDDENGHGLTTVLVVHKTGKQMPGQGFFKMAESQGRDISDRVDLWMSELKSVHGHWSKPGKK